MAEDICQPHIFDRAENTPFEYVTSPVRAREVIAEFIAFYNQGDLSVAFPPTNREYRDFWNGNNIFVVPPALDFETTDLQPEKGAEVRLTTICCTLGCFIIDHFKCGSFKSYADDLAQIPWLVFNAKFEGDWFDFHTEQPDKVKLWDVAMLRKAKMGGGPLSLRTQAAWDLGVMLNKEEQLSDWSKNDLTLTQLIYAAQDAIATFQLGIYWLQELDIGQFNSAIVLNDVWRPTVEMEKTGFCIDEAYHQKLIAMWQRRRDVAERKLRSFTPADVLPNLRSKKQISDFLKTLLDQRSIDAWTKTEKTKQLKTDRNLLRQASYRAPYPLSRWLAALMVFNRADKYLSTYGEKLLTAQRLAGRVYPRFNIAQAITTRYSSSGAMNGQNVPRGPSVRSSFVAPKGATMVLADYSGIELRVLAEISGDEQLKEDVIYGDVHAESAIQLFHRHDPETFREALAKKVPAAKEQRSKAKAFSFQLTYGAGNAALAVVLRCSDEEAGDFVNRWARRYPKAYGYRQLMYEKMMIDGFLPLITGGTIYVPRSDRTMPVASNYPIQGAAAQVMNRALVRVRNRLSSHNISARLLATVHDEILMYALPHDADAAMEQLQIGMAEGWLDVFPGTSTDNLIESAIGNSWAAKP